MDPFTSNFLSGLLASLTTNVFQALSGRIRDSIEGTEKEQAFRNCIEIGLMAIISAASSDVQDEERQKLLKDIFKAFFEDPQVGIEIQWLLRGKPLNKDRLLCLFEDAGYVAGTLDIDFDSAITKFQAGFILAAQEEPTLQGIIQTSQLLEQIHLQHEILNTMRELVNFMRQALSHTVTIQGDKIIGHKIDSHEQIVFQLPYIKAESQRDTMWENHYLRTLISKYEDLDLSSIDRAYSKECKPGDSCPVKISDVFTTLYLKGLSRFPDGDIGAVIQKRDRPSEVFRKDEEIPIQAIEAVGAVPCVVLLGQPGGGKSTVVNHMATQLARQHLGESSEILPGWSSEEKLMPIHIVLRRFAAWLPKGIKRADAGLVWRYVEEQLKEWGCRDAFTSLEKKLIEEGGALFFDGLDEVSESDEQAKRSMIIEAIHAFAKPLMDKCHIVITCREYAYRRGDAWHLPESEFPVVELALFENKQIEHFTHTWYSVVGTEKGWTAARCQQEASNLYQAVIEWSHLHELAQYPLLLTLMAQVHGRDGYLPADRADLYDRAVELLLAQWENRIIRDIDGSRKVEPGLVMRLGIKSRTLKEALERVAFAAHERQEQQESRSARSADIPKEDLREELSKELKSLDKAEEVITYIQERSGLLQARDNRTYAFPHRTFQEYLTATYCLLQSDFDELLARRVKRDLPWWQEVYLLAAGASKTKPRYITNLIDSLIPFGIEEGEITPDEAERVLLAAKALIETDFVSLVKKEEAESPGRFSVTYRRIHNWLKGLLKADTLLFPKKRAQAGVELARLGDDRAEVMTVKAMKFCLVPAGPFWMGEDESLHLNKDLNYDYWMAQYPVTNVQYGEFVHSGGYKEARYWSEAVKAGYWKDGKMKDSSGNFREEPYNHGTPFTLSNHPVVGVSWYEAIAFAQWLTEKWHKEGVLPQEWLVTLPSEAEWEKAARGGVEIPKQFVKFTVEETKAISGTALKSNPDPKREYPWGDDESENLANSRDAGIKSTSAVGCFPQGASPYGCQEMAGNVWEWCRDKYEERGSERVLRGGSWFYDARCCRSAARDGIAPDDRFSDIGFRLSFSRS